MSKAQCKRGMDDLGTLIKNSVPTVEQERSGEEVLIRVIQQSHFPAEYKCLKVKQQIPNDSSIRKLAPFFDDATGLLRVGSRSRKANMPLIAKHQILLPRDHAFTNSLISYFHSDKLFHAGPMTVLLNVRARYWPVGGLQVTRSIISKCVWCFCLYPKMMSQIMGQLPVDRVDFKNTKAFLVTGVDFAGPIRVRHHARCK